MRLLSFAILSYFLAYIDRINVSFAGLTMVAKGNACRASSRAMLTPVAHYRHPRTPGTGTASISIAGTGFRLLSSTQRRTDYRRERERVVGPSRKGNVPERLKGQARKPSLLLWGPRVRIPLPSQQSVSPVNSVNCRRSGPALGTTACRSS
jgi:hypothetical protein